MDHLLIALVVTADVALLLLAGASFRKALKARRAAIDAERRVRRALAYDRAVLEQSQKE